MNKRLIFIGPLPGEVNGQNLVTKRVLDQFSSSGVDLRVVDTSARPSSLPLKKLFSHFRACLTVLLFPGDVYLSLNSNHGLWLSLLVAAFAGLQGKKIGVHHHAFAPIKHKSIAMTLLVKIIAKRGFHIVLGQAMGSGLKKQYPGVGRISLLSNVSIIPLEYTEISREQANILRIGHLSNLTVDKGCVQVLNAAVAAKLAGFNVELNLAGPVSDNKVLDQINKAREVLKGDLRVWGPVYGDDKKSFFGAIDIFIFPSTYKNEAQPLVLLESLAAGVAAAATDIGCVADDIGSTGGLIIRNGEEGVEDIVEFLGICLKDKSLHERQARERFCELLEESRQQFLAITDLYFDSKCYAAIG